VPKLESLNLALNSMPHARQRSEETVCSDESAHHRTPHSKRQRGHSRALRATPSEQARTAVPTFHPRQHRAVHRPLPEQGRRSAATARLAEGKWLRKKLRRSALMPNLLLYPRAGCFECGEASAEAARTGSGPSARGARNSRRFIPVSASACTPWLADVFSGCSVNACSTASGQRARNASNVAWRIASSPRLPAPDG